jgi:hypothetical protein
MATRPALVLILLVVSWLHPLLFAASEGAASERNELTFEQDVRPIFERKCSQCHWGSVRKGDLNLSTMTSFRKGGESGDDLTTTELADNWLWGLVEENQMPPDGETPLSEQEKHVIKRWLIAGTPSNEAVTASDDSLNQHDVLPIVLLRCVTCHGAQRQDGGLDLRTPESMLVGGDSGPALIRGDANASRMIQRIESEACPPSELLLKFFVRRPPEHEVSTLRRWIDQGATVETVAPDVATSKPDPLVTPADRQHWAFRPPSRTPGRTSVDGFVQAKLAGHDLAFAAQASRDTLIRRAYIDLLGLPPDLDEYRRWKHSEAADWYERMIDHLLASPHYGERWGRYWLDLAGYADSEGGISADPIRPVAWKYRDYVIRSFNQDKPYDQFLIEQLAGDELIDYQQAEQITEEMVENLIATGFLRMGIDETGSRTMNFVPERLKVISDAIHVVSSGLMGLTMECARCHSHKYDPIPQRDYYRFKAIFQGALDEHDWRSFKNRKLNVATPAHLQRIKQTNPPLAKRLKKLQSQKRAMDKELRLALLRFHHPEQSEAENEQTLVALKRADNQRTLTQKKLVERLQQAELLPDEDQSPAVIQLRQEIERTQRQIETTEREMVPPPTIRALWDAGRPSPTYLLRRGEHNKPGPLVGAGVPSVLTDGKTPFQVQAPFPDGTTKTGRRLALAKWMTRPDHPLTARVMVNRVWYHHFGRGLVTSLENFGRQAEPPTHPGLLDWLALEFVEGDWSIKRLHRLIMTSRTYKQTSRISEAALRRDPQNRLYSRMPLRRMDAEALRDSLLFVSNCLDDRPGGLPDPIRVDRDGMVRVLPTTQNGWRRSVYLQYRRTQIPTMMDTFDYPQMGPNCQMRSVSNVAPQALMLLNNDHIRVYAEALAARIQRLVVADVKATETPKRLVTLAYQLALTRSPGKEELRLGVNAIRQFTEGWQGNANKALETYCHTLLNSAAFLYVD